MKQIILILIIFISNIIVSFGQAPDWAWVKSSFGTIINIGDDGYGNEAYSMAADALGNVYVTGYYLSSTIIFDNDTLTNSGSSYDIFLVKYDNDGNVIWARSIGGSGDDEPYSVAADIHGNVYIAGYFKSPELSFGNDTLIITGYSDVLLCKFDANGNALWAKSAKGNSRDLATSVIVDNSDNVYLTGFFQSTPIVFGSDTLNNIGSSDIFIVKYKPNGNQIWAKSYGGNMEDEAYSIAADANGNIFVGGKFFSSFFTLGSDTLFNSASGYTDMFLIKCDSTSNVLWAKSAGSSSDERIYTITTDISGNVYVAGVFFSHSFILRTTTLINSFSFSLRADFFIAKYNTGGQVLWAKSGGGIQYDGPKSIATDASGNVNMTICYNSPSIIIGSDTLHNAGLYDGAIVEYDLNGNMLWTKAIGGSRDDGAFAVTVNSFDNIFIAGYYQSPVIVFDSYTLTSQDTNYSAVFVASIENILTGETNIEKQEPIYIYPNPCKGMFTVKSANMDKEAVLSIYNILGDKIFFKEKLSNFEQIDLSGYTKGMYFVKLQSAKGISIVKVIVE